MRLYLAVAVLMLASLACTEAQEDTFQEQLAAFGQRLAQGSQDLAQKVQATFDQIHNSEVATSSRSFFNEQIEKLKTKFQEYYN